MSNKSTGKKTAVVNEINEILYDAFKEVRLPENFPNDPLWPEWNDADINSETWGNGNRIRTQTTSKVLGKSDLTIDSAQIYYTDLEPSHLPSELRHLVASWKRPREVFSEDDLTIYDPSNTDLSLKPPSDAADCKLFRFVSDVCRILNYHALSEPFLAEDETPYYSSNTKGQPWQPWHHIYGNCKAGKDQPHRPMYSSFGKYILRLHYFGAWRKFVVDDQIPCDADGRCILPMTKNQRELWPIILVKGILKILSLTSISPVSLKNLSLWTLFTGWTPGTFGPRELRKNPNYAWRFLCIMLPDFSAKQEQENNQTENLLSLSSKGTMKKTEEKKDDEDGLIFCIAEIDESSLETKKLETSILAILETRDKPLSPFKMRKPTEPWKRIRWVHWAANRGLWTDEQLVPPYRCLHVINISEELQELLRIEPETESKLFIMDENAEENSSNEENSSHKWIDFNKIIKHISCIKFLLKPSTLNYRCKITYINLGPPAAMNANVKGKSMVMAEPLRYYLPPAIKVSDNEPPILYCESIQGIFIVFSLYVTPKDPINNESYLSPDQPEFLSVYHGSLLVEIFDWRSSSQSNIIAAVKTIGHSTTCVTLTPGRYTLRLWLDTDSPFLIDVFSNTEFLIEKGPKIRLAMSKDSNFISRYLQRFSNSFIELVQNFGRPEYTASLTQFYFAIRPLNSITPSYRIKLMFFINAFSYTLVNCLATLTSSEELHWMAKALRSLFLDPYLPYPKGAAVNHQQTQKKGKKDNLPTVPERQERTFSETTRNWTDEENKKAVTIQRIFRGFCVRQLLAYHSPTNKDHKILSEKLKKICDLVFSPNKREVEASRLLREMITSKPEFGDTFRFYKSIGNVIVCEEFSGKIPNVEPKSWVPMIRFVFACHSKVPLPCIFYHSCNLEHFTVSVTDNDTNKEIFRLGNYTCSHYYTTNQAGYTLFVYGWNESETKTVNWRLEMVKMKYFLDIHPCNMLLTDNSEMQCNPYKPQPLSMQEIRNFYLPNKRSKICSCLIKVRKKILVSIRIAVSFEGARFYTRVYQQHNSTYSDSESSTEDVNTVIEAETKSSAIIFPSVLLDHSRRSSVARDYRDEQVDQTVYVLEVFVANNSWPLTNHEWGVVEPIRVNGETWLDSPLHGSLSQMRKSSTSSRRRSLRAPKTSSNMQTVVESPYWEIQIITDASPDQSNILDVAEDRSYQDVIKGMKLSWEENDPGRRHRGKVIQREFLRSIFGEMMETRGNTKISESTLLSENMDRSNNEADSALTIDESFEAMIREIKSFSYLLNDKSTVRYLKSPRLLPKTPLNNLFAKYSIGKSTQDMLTTSESSRNLLGEDYMFFNSEKRPEEVIQEQRKAMLGNMKRLKINLEEHFIRESELSQRLMYQAYEDRRLCFEKMKSFSNNNLINKGLINN